MSGLQVIVEDLSTHPRCPHGPTLLFSRQEKDKQRKFFACSACRDRKDCNFFLYEDEKEKFNKPKKALWEEREKKHIAGINHQNLYFTLTEVKNSPANTRMYCLDCGAFQLNKYKDKHKEHKHVEGISNQVLTKPSEFLIPIDNSKKEAQYLFAKKSVKLIVDTLRQRNLRNVICIGAPRIHEYIINNYDDMNSILLDIDKRYLDFYGPMQFFWYNTFNNHFFLKNSYELFKEFLQNDGGLDHAIVTDPPFGGRTEPLVESLRQITSLHKKLNKIEVNMPVIWIFPYFMEPQIINSLPDFIMLDYKVDYDNHPLFSEGSKGRKQGSPVRIFTNIKPGLIPLPEDEGYTHCKICDRWISAENKHCKKCKCCTSKDGRTYKHCNPCKRCVKPTWEHCVNCQKCALPTHKCGKIEFNQACFHCKEKGHKRRDCPKAFINSKRKMKNGTNGKKAKRIKKA